MSRPLILADVYWTVSLQGLQAVQKTDYTGQYITKERFILTIFYKGREIKQEYPNQEARDAFYDRLVEALTIPMPRIQRQEAKTELTQDTKTEKEEETKAPPITFLVTLTPDDTPIWDEINRQDDPPAYVLARLKAGIEDAEFPQVQVMWMEEPAP